MKRLCVMPLAVLLLAAPAVAQTTAPPATPPTTATTPGATTTTPGATVTTPGTTVTTPGTTAQSGQLGTGGWYTAANGEMRASKIIGTAVRNQAGESIGDVNEILLGRNGQVAAIVIGVGGFLGLGEREVAISPQGFRMATDASGNTTITVNADRDVLRNAPAWNYAGKK